MKQFVRNFLPQLLGLCLLVVASGCSTTYHRHWKRAAERPVAAESVEGRWEGAWLSDKNGHHGKLRCIVTEKENGQYQFHYWARFWKIFSASYKVDFSVSPTSDGYVLNGSEDLGWLYGGVYTHKGTVKDQQLNASYECRIDQGNFEMLKVTE